MKKKIILSFAILSLVFNPAYAQVFVGDSVMSPNDNTSNNTVTGSAGNISLPSYTNENLNDIQFGTCPAGFTYNGSSQYPLQIRTLTNYYLGGIYVGQSASSWYDTDASCNATQYQTIGCPVNYTGNQLQSRLASTRDGNSFDYSAWNTYQNNCVYVPPRASGVVDSIIASVRSAQFNGFSNQSLSGNIGSQMSVSYGTRFGVTVYRPSAQLNCVVSSDWGGQGGDAGSSGYAGKIMSPGQSFSGSGGYCSLSNGNMTATISGDCNSTSGGDGDFCQGATYTINITSVNECNVYTETRANGKVIGNTNYNICN